jgi:hypothetical protein
MHWVPWLAGGFLLTPFVVWLVLALVMFPGAWNGFAAVVGTGALGASLPLAVWFFLRGVGGFANAMAGADPDGELVHRIPRVILRALPASAIVLGLVGAGAVITAGQALWAAAAPLVVGGFVAAGIHAGERGISRGVGIVPGGLRRLAAGRARERRDRTEQDAGRVPGA